MQAKLVEIKEALYRMLHVPVPEQGHWLGQVVRGYLAYHAVPTNARAITAFVHYVTWHWKRALGRRSQKGRVTWDRMAKIAALCLPSARINHPYPQQRFIVKHPRWEPSALAAPARICRGGARQRAYLPGWGSAALDDLLVRRGGARPAIRLSGA